MLGLLATVMEKETKVVSEGFNSTDNQPTFSREENRIARLSNKREQLLDRRDDSSRSCYIVPLAVKIAAYFADCSFINT